MTKIEKKKLSLTDLIENKDKYQVKTGVEKDLYLEQLGATVTILQPERSMVLDSFESESDEYLVYNIVIEPNLKDPGLQKKYECMEPMDIVTKIFDPGTVTGIAKAGLKLAGYDSKVKMVEDLKN